MSEGYFLVNEKTGREFQIVSFDPAKGEATLMGEHKVPWVETFDDEAREAYKANGYVMVKKPLVQETADA